MFYEINEQCTRNEGVNSNKIIRTYVGIATRIFTICGCILLLALITTMQRCFGVSNSKPDPRATCTDEYDRCSTVNSILYRPLEEVWFKAVALLAAYEGLDREAEQWARPSSFPYSACPIQWMVWYKRLPLACGVTRLESTRRSEDSLLNP